MIGGRAFVPVHPSQSVQASPLVESLAEEAAQDLAALLDSSDDEDIILKHLLEHGADGEQLLGLALRNPRLAARLLARTIDERRSRKATPEAPAAPPPVARPAVPRKQRILVVEDDHKTRETVCRFLMAMGYEVEQAGNGVEAMRHFHRDEPDFVVCDVYMPRMNGFKVLMEMKSQNPDLPFLLMTGSVAVGQVFENFRYPNVGYLPKPFRLAELAGRVQEYLGVAS
jgi:CheY-like chemotaxis protein